MSSGCDGNREGGSKYSSVFLYLRLDEVGLPYDWTSKLLLLKLAVMTKGPLAL